MRRVSARTPSQPWLKSRMSFWTWGQAHSYLFYRVASSCNAEVFFEDGGYMIRGKGGRYLLNSGEMGFPVSRELELEKMP